MAMAISANSIAMSSEVPSGPDESIPTQREVYHEIELIDAKKSSLTSVAPFDEALKRR